MQKGGSNMIVSRRKPTASGDRPASARLPKWAGLVCLGAVLAPAAWAQADTPIDFTISDDRVVPTEDFAVKVSVLGAAISYNGTDFPVTTQLIVDGQIYEPFGPLDDPEAGDVNDHSPPRHFIVPQVFDPSVSIAVASTSWHFDLSEWKSRNTSQPSDMVMVLRNGDPVPNIDGFGDQADAADLVATYIDTDTNTMSLDINQVIYLFELATDDVDSAYADFQDLVVLVTLGTTPEALEAGDMVDASYD